MNPNQDVLGFGDKIESEHEEKQERMNNAAEVHKSDAANALQITNRTSGPAVKCLSIVRDIDTDRYLVRLEFRMVDGTTKTVELPRELDATTMVARLLGLGADLPHGHGQATKLLRQALGAPGLLVAETSSRTGWWEQSFRTRDEVIGPASSRLTLRPRDDKLPTRAGDLAPWQAGLRRACNASSYLTTVTALGFAGPLIRCSKIAESALVYLRGKGSLAKTTTLQAMVSVFGNADRSALPTLAITDRALEEKAFESNDLSLALDEAGRIEGRGANVRVMLDKIGHAIASGHGCVRSKKATADETLANLTWRTIAVATGEIPLNDHKHPTERQLGAQVRAIEIVIPSKDEGGVFDRRKNNDPSPKEMADAARSVVEANFGVALPAFMRPFVDDLVRSEQRARNLIERFIRRVGADGDGWESRFASKFALAYAAGRMAAEFGVAPWRPKDIFPRVARVYRRSRENLFTADEAADDLLRRLADRDRRKRLLPMLSKGKALPAKHAGAPGFRRKENGATVLALHRARLKDLVRPAHLTDKVVKVLDQRGLLLPGKEGRYVRQIQMKGFGNEERPYFIVIPLAKLKGA